MDTSHIGWQSVTINSLELFQLKDESKECRKLMVKLDYSNYKVRGRQDADTRRSGPALLRVYNHVVAISGKNLLTASSHDMNTNKWDGNLANVNEARHFAAACLLGNPMFGHVYLFSGQGNNGVCLNSIEKIRAASLLYNRIATWTLI